jgi:hypothetical protein
VRQSSKRLNQLSITYNHSVNDNYDLPGEPIRLFVDTGNLEGVNKLLMDPIFDPSANPNNYILKTLSTSNWDVVEHLIDEF